MKRILGRNQVAQTITIGGVQKVLYWDEELPIQWKFEGTAVPDTPEPDAFAGAIVYVASQNGTYTGFDNIEILDESAFLMRFGTDPWQKHVIGRFPLPIEEQYKSWALSESMTFSNISYDSEGIIESANITWPNGETGVVQNVVTDDFGISEIQYTAPGGYVKVEVTYSNEGFATGVVAIFV